MVAAKSKEQSSTDEVEGKEDKDKDREEKKSANNEEKAQKNKKRKFGASAGGGGFFPKGKPAGDNNSALNAMKRIKLKVRAVCPVYFFQLNTFVNSTVIHVMYMYIHTHMRTACPYQ